MDVFFLEQAEKELDEAFNYCQQIQPELGFRFLQEFESAIKRLCHFPLSYAKIGHSARRCLVQKFPYGVIYQFHQKENTILVIAVAHLHRKPGYWKPRDK